MKGVSKEVCYLVASTFGIVDQSELYAQGSRAVLERFALQASARVLPAFSTLLVHLASRCEFKDFRSSNPICKNVCTNALSDSFNLSRHLLSRHCVYLFWDWCDNCNQFNSRMEDCDLFLCGVFVSYIDYIISIWHKGAKAYLNMAPNISCRFQNPT